MVGLAVMTDSGLAQASSTGAPILANVPIKLFGIGFLVVLVVFLAWYMYMRRG